METPVRPGSGAATVMAALMKAALPACALIAASIGAARADAVADFYRGRTVTVLVGVSVGGE